VAPTKARAPVEIVRSATIAKAINSFMTHLLPITRAGIASGQGDGSAVLIIHTAARRRRLLRTEHRRASRCLTDRPEGEHNGNIDVTSSLRQRTAMATGTERQPCADLDFVQSWAAAAPRTLTRFLCGCRDCAISRAEGAPAALADRDAVRHLSAARLDDALVVKL
jgi:hypothetical protein